MDIQKQLLPDLIDVLKKRYSILHHIMLSDSIGRRALAASLRMSERVLRSETDQLKSLGLIEIESHGMRVSDAGRQLLDDFEPIVKELFGLSELEDQIARQYNLKQVIIVPGDSDESPLVKKELGRAGAAVLRKSISKDDVIAVTGGSTLAEIAQHLTSPTPFKGIQFVPARGGLGESLELQANTIASTMAKRTGAQYRLLHVPDNLSEDAYQSLISEPNVREVLEVLRRARIVVHGIGDAMTMALRRRVDQETIDSLQTKGALAEAFGFYFDKEGQIVHMMPMLGLRIAGIEQAEIVIAVAGGASKGRAIASVLRFGHEDVLVTDEAAAHELIRCLD